MGTRNKKIRTAVNATYQATLYACHMLASPRLSSELDNLGLDFKQWQKM
jgi:hypothetical protein